MLFNKFNIFKNCISNKNIHTGIVSLAWPSERRNCDSWKKHNEKVYPPQNPDEPPRPAFVCHVKENFKYSYKRLWYIASFVRGMSIDEALKQLQFVNRKGSIYVRDTLLEAQDMAVKQHNVEFKSNLWVSESFVGKGMTIKGMRRHAKGRIGTIDHRYSHYFCTLEEGKPPEHYYPHRRTKTADEHLQGWLEELRCRKIHNSL